MSSRLTWRDDNLQHRLREAAKRGVNETMGACVREAKSNHPGWNNVTGAASASVKITQTAAAEGAGIVGRWGSTGVHYVRWLEFLHGSFLRNAASVHYPRLDDAIRRHFR